LPALNLSINQLNQDLGYQSLTFESYLREKYAADFKEREENGPKKLNTADFKELHRAFTESLNT